MGLVYTPADAVYWMAIAHLPNWNRERINILLEILLKSQFPLSEFFALNSEEWQNLFHLSEREIESIFSIKKKLPSFFALVEDLYNQGYEMIPVHSKVYSSHLRETLGKQYAPSILYVKGNVSLLNQPSACLFGSRHSIGRALIFSHNIVQDLVHNQKVIITSYDLGFDRLILNWCVQAGGKCIVILGEGVLALQYPIDAYSQYIASRKMLFLSTLFPKYKSNQKLMRYRDMLICGFAKDIYIADSSEKRWIWQWIIQNLKRGYPFYVRIPDKDENNANHLFIANGAIPVNMNGRIFKAVTSDDGKFTDS